jgi:hypothetical protein
LRIGGDDALLQLTIVSGVNDRKGRIVCCQNGLRPVRKSFPHARLDVAEPPKASALEDQKSNAHF